MFNSLKKEPKNFNIVTRMTQNSITEFVCRRSHWKKLLNNRQITFPQQKSTIAKKIALLRSRSLILRSPIELRSFGQMAIADRDWIAKKRLAIAHTLLLDRETEAYSSAFNFQHVSLP